MDRFEDTVKGYSDLELYNVRETLNLRLREAEENLAVVVGEIKNRCNEQLKAVGLFIV
jgi:hypothetical protein